MSVSCVLGPQGRDITHLDTKKLEQHVKFCTEQLGKVRGLEGGGGERCCSGGEATGGYDCQGCNMSNCAASSWAR